MINIMLWFNQIAFDKVSTQKIFRNPIFGFQVGLRNPQIPVHAKLWELKYALMCHSGSSGTWE